MRYRDACVMKLRYLVAMVRKSMPVRVNAVPGNIPPRIGRAPSGSTATGLATQKPLETRLEITVESSPLHVVNGNPCMENMKMISGHSTTAPVGYWMKISPASVDDDTRGTATVAVHVDA